MSTSFEDHSTSRLQMYNIYMNEHMLCCVEGVGPTAAGRGCTRAAAPGRAAAAAGTGRAGTAAAACARGAGRAAWRTGCTWRARARSTGTGPRARRTAAASLRRSMHWLG